MEGRGKDRQRWRNINVSSRQGQRLSLWLKDVLLTRIKPGTEPRTCQPAGWHSNHWAISARAKLFHFLTLCFIKTKSLKRKLRRTLFLGSLGQLLREWQIFCVSGPQNVGGTRLSDDRASLPSYHWFPFLLPFLPSLILSTFFSFANVSSFPLNLILNLIFHIKKW